MTTATLQAIAKRLGREPRKQVPYQRVLVACQAEIAALRDTPDHRSRMQQLLTGGEQLGLWRLPKGPQHWQPGRPPLPLWIRMPSVVKAGGDSPDTAWLPLMAFANQLRNASERVHARHINTWLRENGPSAIRVPSRERSLQIFGDEKKLDRISTPAGQLFGGRLSLDDLGCFTVALPLPYELPARPVPGAAVLVVENHHSYWSFCEWNRERRAYAAVAYGSGDAFRSAARHLDQIRQRSEAGSLKYFGDIDPRGIAIGCEVDQARRELGLSPLLPALNHYRWLLQNGSRRPLKPAAIGAMPHHSRLLAWLGSEVLGLIEALFQRGEWLPQEALGLESLIAGDQPRP